MKRNDRRGMGRKAAAEEMVEQIPYIVLTILVMAGVYFLLSYYSNTTIDVAPVQANVFLYRVIYEPNALSYTDPDTGAVSPGIISASNFTSEHLDQAIKYEYERQIMARFVIYDKKSGFRKEAYYNKVWFDRLEPLSSAGIAGSSSAKAYSRELPVIYRAAAPGSAYGFTDIPARMNVTIIIPN